MPRAHRQMTWRVQPRYKSLSILQGLVPKDGEWHWVIVAHGNYADLKQIAGALNQARFTLNDTRLVPSTEKKR